MQMKTILGYQEVTEIVEEGFLVHTTDATDVQKALYKEKEEKEE